MMPTTLKSALFCALLLATVISATFAQTVRTLPPTNPSLERTKSDAQAAHVKGDFSTAIELSTKVLQSNPNDHVALYIRAGARVELGQALGDAKLIRDGIADARQAIAASQSRDATYYLPYLYGMAILARTENRPEHAEVALKVADQALARPNLNKEDKANLYYQRASIRMILKDVDGAIKDHENALADDPRHFGSRVALAHTYAGAGNQEKALENFTKLVETFPNNPQAYNDRGSYLMSIGRLDDAVVEFTRAVEIEPNFVVGFINRGYAFFTQGDLKAAENDFSAALKVDPDHPTAYTMRGDTRLMEGRVPDALADYNRALQVQPDNPSFLANVAFAKFVSRDYRGALADYEKALRIDPNAVHLNSWRAWSQVILGNKATVQQQFAAVRKKPTNERTWFDQLILHAMGDVSDEQLLDAAEKKDENVRRAQLAEAYYFVGLRKAISGDVKGATQDFQKSVATGQNQLFATRAAKLAISGK